MVHERYRLETTDRQRDRRTDDDIANVNVSSRSLKIWTDLSSILSNHECERCDRRTDGQTDGQIEFSSLDRVCIPCSAVKSRTVVTPNNTLRLKSIRKVAQLANIRYEYF